MIAPVQHETPPEKPRWIQERDARRARLTNALHRLGRAWRRLRVLAATWAIGLALRGLVPLQRWLISRLLACMNELENHRTHGRTDR